MFTLGDLVLPSNVFCAPLAGCSDYPFRKMTTRYKPGLVYCEMVKMDALVRHDPHTYRLMDFEADMHPIGAQICGSKVEYAAKSAKIVEELGFDVVDLNCGCPVDKVTKDGSGSAMLKTPELVGDIIAEMVAAVKIPVTVKIRAGWDHDQINAPLITEIAERAGAKAICIHGRTREQGYTGNANWDYIKACKEVAKNIKVIGNGDLFSAENAMQMFAHTGCDAILISRGTFGNPWIVEDVYRALQGEPAIERSSQDYKNALLDHFHYVTAYQPKRKALLDLRRISCWYLKGVSHAKELREKINSVATLEDLKALLQRF